MVLGPYTLGSLCPFSAKEQQDRLWLKIHFEATLFVYKD
jgi:hypothetical protein